MEEKREPECLLFDEIFVLIASIDHPYKYGVALAGLAGLRAGEIMGLKWKDIEFLGDEKGKITIERQMDTEGKIVPPKSESCKATLPMVKPLTKLLEVFRTTRPDDREYLFQNEDERIGDWWNKNIRGKLVPADMRFHDLRQSFALNLVYKGVTILMIKKLMRHSDLQTTFDAYKHMMQEIDIWDLDI